MQVVQTLMRGIVCLVLLSTQWAFASSLIIDGKSTSAVPLGSTVWFVGNLDGKNVGLEFSVNGIKGGNASLGTINSQNGQYNAPTVMPPNGKVIVSGTTRVAPFMTAERVVQFISKKVPTIYRVTPSRPVCGTTTFTIEGIDFLSGAVAQINNVAMPTVVNSSTKISVSANLQKNGTLAFAVLNASDAKSNVFDQVSVSACGTTGTGTSSGTGTGSGTGSGTGTGTGTGSTGGSSTGGSGTSTGPINLPATDAASVSAARLLEQASFGPTPSQLSQVKQIGASAWITQQMALPASALPDTTDLSVLQRSLFMNMVNGQDQLRQRVIFSLSQIFVVSQEKNPYANEMRPWLMTLSNNAFGNFKTLLREMSLNPSMGKYLDLGNSVTPAPNENYAREVMQLFTIGTVMLNMDGSVQLDANNKPIPTYDQTRIAEFARALSGWTYGGNSSAGLNWESFATPLQARDAYHDKKAKTLLMGKVLPAGQSTQQDFDAVMDNLFNHPNVPPFIATRLIRSLTTSNPSPAYIQRVATVFANTAGVRGDLAATIKAILLDPEARQDTPTATQGFLKDPVLHSLGLIRALNGTVVDPTNMFWDYYLMGEKILSAPSVFSFYSPMTRLPGAPQYYGPAFQIYAPSMAVARSNFLYQLISGNYGTMVKIDLTPFIAAAPNATNLINLVDASLLQGRMSASTRQAISAALSTASDNKERAIIALYFTAMGADFSVHK